MNQGGNKLYTVVTLCGVPEGECLSRGGGVIALLGCYPFRRHKEGGVSDDAQDRLETGQAVQVAVDGQTDIGM